jgi:hypothetical protein
LIIAGGSGNGYRLAELASASNPSGWSGVLKVKNSSWDHTRLHPSLFEPMKIQLDHVQRLNLHALLGAQHGDVATIHALWALQDRLAMTSDEETALALKRESVAGQRPG